MILAHNAAVAPNSVLYNNPLETSQSISRISLAKSQNNSQNSLQESTTHYSNKNLSSQIDENLTGGGDRLKLFAYYTSLVSLVSRDSKRSA